LGKKKLEKHTFGQKQKKKKKKAFEKDLSRKIK